jgi:hypothetical protein
VTVIAVCPADEDPTTVLAAEKTTAPQTPRPKRWLLATVVVGAVLAAAAAVVGLVVLTDAGPTETVLAPRQAAPQANRQAWARQYGQDGSTMPSLPDVGSATEPQRAAAADLLARTQSGTASYGDPAAAMTAGFDVQAALTRAEQAQPRLMQRLQQIDAGRPGRRPVLRVLNKARTHDGKVLDPTAPEMLVYQYQGHNTWKVIGAGYLANESYPKPPPDPGGPITRWHYDNKHPATLSMDVFFAAGNDLAHAFAKEAP